MPTLRDQVRALRTMGRTPEQVSQAMTRAFGEPSENLVPLLDTDVAEIPGRIESDRVLRTGSDVAGAFTGLAQSPAASTTKPASQPNQTMDWAGRPVWSDRGSGSAHDKMRFEQYRKEYQTQFGAEPAGAGRAFGEAGAALDLASGLATGRVKPTRAVKALRGDPESISAGIVPVFDKGTTDTIDTIDTRTGKTVKVPKVTKYGEAAQPDPIATPSDTEFQLPNLPANLLTSLSGAAAGLLGDSKLARSIKASAVRSRGSLVPIPDILDPEGAAKAETAAKRIEALGPRASDPTVTGDDSGKIPLLLGEGVERFRPSMEANAAMRQERQLDASAGTWDNLSRLARNTSKDIGDNIAGIFDLANTLGGITTVDPKDTRNRGEKYAEFGEQVGTGMVGGTIDIVRGLTDIDANTLTTQPLTAMLTLFPALAEAKRLGYKVPGVEAKVARVAEGFDRIGQKWSASAAEQLAKHPRIEAFAKGVASNVGDVKLWVEQQLVEGVRQLDPRATALVEDIAHGGELTDGVIQTALEILQRQLKNGDVQLHKPALEARELQVVPRVKDPVVKAAPGETQIPDEALAGGDLGEVVREAVDPVSAGPVYLPEVGNAGKPLVVEGVEGIRKTFTSAGEGLATDIATAADEAGTLKKSALDQGFNPDTPVADPYYAERWGKTHGEAARNIAEHFKDRARGKGEPEGTTGALANALRLVGVVEGAADTAAQWLESEVRLRDQVKRLEPGESLARRRPPTVIEDFEVGKDGKLLSRMEARRNAPDAANIPKDSAMSRAEQELRLGRSMRIEAEAPHPILTNNPLVNRAVRDIADAVRAKYPDVEAQGTLLSAEGVKIADMHPDAVKRFEGEEMKRLAPETIVQRLLDPLEADSAELMSVREVRNRALGILEQRAKADGMGRAQVKNLLASFAREVNDPSRKSAIAKNKMITVRNPTTGNVLWGRADYADLFNSLPEKARKNAISQRVLEVGADMSNATTAYGMLQSLTGEVNRFRTAVDGTAIPGVWGKGVEPYAKSVADGVIDRGELPPQLMPFRGKDMQAAMEALAEKDPSRADALRRLGAELATHEAVEGSWYGKQLGDFWRTQFKGVEAPPSFEGVFVKPSVKRSLQAQLYLVRSAMDANEGPMAALRQLSNRAKSGVVAENLKTLINNDLANLGLDVFTEANPLATMRDLWTESLKLKMFLDGDTTRLTPAEQMKFRALAETNIVKTSNVSRDIGNTNVWNAIKDRKYGRVVEDWSAGLKGKPGDIVKPFLDFQEFHRDMYSKLGDTPFRIGKASRVYDGLTQRIGMMQAGEYIDIPVSSSGKVRVTALGDGKARVSEMAGPRAKAPATAGEGGVVSIDGPEIAKYKALNGKLEQANIYADYGRTGNYAKYLRASPVTSLISGIFSWFFFAMDIPGVKKGLVGRALDGPAQYETSSAAVKAMQRSERANLHWRRLALTASAREAIRDQEQLRELREAFAYGPEASGVILAKSTHPYYAQKRDIGTVLWSSPTQAVLGGLERAAQFAEYGFLGDPQEVAELLKDTSPGLTGNLPPEERAEAARRRRVFMDMAQGKRFNLDSLVTIAGLSGGPLFNTILRWRQGKIDGASAAREFMRMMVGGTVASAANTLTSGVGQAADKIGEVVGEGAENAAREVGSWSTYGEDEARHGFHQGQLSADEAGWVRWAVRNALGVGWMDIALFGKEADLTKINGDKFQAQGDRFLSRAMATLSKALTSSAQKARVHGDENAAGLARDIDGVVNREIEWMRGDLKKQLNLLKR